MKVYPYKLMRVKLTSTDYLSVVFIGLFTCLGLPIVPLQAQNTSANTRIELQWLQTVASSNEQAFWLTRNDFGLLRDDGANTLTGLRLAQKLLSTDILDVSAGTQVVYNLARGDQAWLPMAWVKAEAFGLELQAGRFDMAWENPADPQLTSGDLRFGRASVPMPMVRLHTPDWVEIIPFFPTFQVKGMMLHGWLEDNRAVQDAFVHTKSAQLSLDLDGFRPRCGMTHMVQWGGNSRTGGELPSGFSDFVDVFFGRSGNENAPLSEQINVLGNHLGTWDMGFDWQSEEFEASFIWHHLFDDGSGQRMRNGSDGMLRTVLKRRDTGSQERHFVEEFVFEHINTTNSSGWGGSDSPDGSSLFDEFGFRLGGRETYYTNGIYANGWTYLGQPMHNPLFMTTTEANRWAPEGQQVNGTASYAATSILAHHVAWKGQLPDWIPGNLRYRQKTSIVRYYGNAGTIPRYFAPYRANDQVRSSDYAFYPDIVQFYVRLDIEKDWVWGNYPIQTTLSLAADRGEWHRTFGLSLGMLVQL